MWKIAMDRYDTLYERERRVHQDQGLDLIRDYGFFAPAKMARDEAYQQLMDEAARDRFLRSADGTDRLASRIETARHRLGALLIRLGTTLQGAAAVAPRLPSAAGAAAADVSR
jgi:hypothetical protein